MQQILAIVPARRLIAILSIFIGFGSPTVFAAAPADTVAFDRDLVPLLRTYCFDCHGDAGAEGEINLESYASPEAVMEDRKLWMRALKQVQIGAMPPADGSPLDPETRKKLAKMIDDTVNAVNCVEDPNAGKVVMRRLNRFEYRNTVRDLLGVDYEPSSAFPGDDVGYGFDNIGDVLSLPPLLMEKYLIAADEISQIAIKVPEPAELFEFERSGGQMEGGSKDNSPQSAMPMYSNSTATLEVPFPFPAEYSLTITARGDQAGPDPCRLRVIIGGKEVGTIDVPSSEPADYTITFRTGRGSRPLSIEFTNDFYDKKSKGDRNAYIEHLTIRAEGQRKLYIPVNELPKTHLDLIFAVPDDFTTVEAATKKVLERLLSRAYRRPATSTEVSRLCNLAAKVREGGGTYDESIQVTVQAVLISPHFLFKVETTQPKGPDGQSLPLTQFELATRLSYMLWSSMPDDSLFKSAWEGKLSDSKILRSHVARMIKDRRSNAFVENFAGQWLQLRNLDRLRPDERKFPQATPEMLALMKRETLTFFAGVMRENMPVTTLLDGSFTYLNEDLANYYGIKGVEGDDFRLVSLKGTPRGGVLTQASILTVTSNPSRTSPVKRGKWILENLLNTPPPPPPPNVPELEKDVLSGTLREKMEQHRADPACATCHNMMDPLGFALENFDAVGRWRTRDGRDDIDASGELPDGTKFTGVAELREILSKQMRDQFVHCLTEKMMIYALGRGLEYYDKCAVDEIVGKLESNNYRFAYLIAAIVESRPFQSQGVR